MSTTAKAKSPGAYHFHPLELSLVGYSGSGKTTLIVRLIQELKARWSLAYVKHDAHSFEMDKPGKDTQRAQEAGAQAIYISNANRFAWLGEGENSLFTLRSQFLDADALIIEGYKTLPLDKICVLDAEGDILNELSAENLETIQAFVGAETTAPRKLPAGIPYFGRDQIEEITQFIEDRWTRILKSRPLRALVLAGGRSERMGQDKGRLSYYGKPQALWLCDQLQQLDIQPLLSVREGQWRVDELESQDVLIDRFIGFGPLSGILSAMHEDKTSAWLVVACDLPLLTADTIQHLLKERDPRKMATAFRSSSDGLPEPLCAVYEPKIRMRLHQAMGLGLNCPRKVLLNTASHIIEAIDREALANANTPSDFASFRQTLKERSHDA